MENSKYEEFELSPKHKAAIYARKSIKFDNNSIHSQLQEAKQILLNEKLVLYNTYIDNGVSATETTIEERKGLNQLLQDAQNNKFKTVVVYKSDRIARDIEQAIKIRNIFRKNNIRVIYSSQKDFPVSEGYISNFIQNILMGLDQLEADTIKRRVSMGKRNKRLRGEYSSGKYLPFGYITKPGAFTSNYCPDEHNSSMIKDFFIQCASDITPPTTKEDFLKIASKCFYQLNKKINVPFINSIINKPVYGGLLLIESDTDLLQAISIDKNKNFSLDYNLIRDCVNVKPTIIDKQTYCKVFLRWDSVYEKQNYTTYNYVFQGLLQCEHGFTIKGSLGHYKCTRITCKNCKDKATCTTPKMCEKYLICKDCKSTTKGIDIEKSSLEKLILAQIINELCDASYLKTHIQKKISEKLHSIECFISNKRKSLKNNKLAQDVTLKELMVHPNITAHKDSLNKLLEEEATLIDLINAKEKQLHSIKANFENNTRLYSMILELSKIDKLLDSDHIENTKRHIHSIIEKIILKPERHHIEIKELDYGN
ncbi:MAG: recombinase family protein [Marinisporobacter sp.]|jgi:DNA invertase Pin-like site-specific DNA recombinase|nr:recombinase family protein [Marinisporobacter sp.]